MPENGDEISPDDPVDTVDGVGSVRRDDLEDAGYETVRDLQESDVSDLTVVVPDDVARSIKDQVGDRITNYPNVSEAKDKARKIPGAKAKIVRQGGTQQAKVLRKQKEEHVGGATVEIHKG